MCVSSPDLVFTLNPCTYSPFTESERIISHKMKYTRRNLPPYTYYPGDGPLPVAFSLEVTPSLSVCWRLNRWAIPPDEKGRLTRTVWKAKLSKEGKRELSKEGNKSNQKRENEKQPKEENQSCQKKESKSCQRKENQKLPKEERQELSKETYNGPDRTAV